MKAVEFKDGESDTYIFEAVVENKEYSEDDEDTDSLKATIEDLTKQVADFKEKAKKNTEIKDLKTQVKDLTIQLAKLKDDAAGKDELAKELREIKDNLRTKDFKEFIDKQIEAGV